MRKRKINPQYLRSITSQDVRDEEIAALDFAKALEEFASEYLGGIMDISIEGASSGSVRLNLPVSSYLIRLLCECGDSDDTVSAKIHLSDTLIISVDYKSKRPTDDVAHMVKVARLAGFEVSRTDTSLTFKADIKLTSIMQVYAVSTKNFRDMLVITYQM